MRITRDEAVQKYGAIENGKWAFETYWCVIVQVPDEIAKHWINAYTGAPTRKIYCNREMASALEASFALAQARGLASEFKSFDGCFMVRSVRGDPNAFSWHSYAMAFDLNAKTNALGTEGDLSPELAACFVENGFVHGRDFSRKDPMHFQYADG